MRIERVVVDASPLIVLYKAGLAELLPRLFSKIIVPEAVWNEVLAGGANDVAARSIGQSTWITHEPVAEISSTITAWDLGIGESSVIAIAARDASTRAILDDRQARNLARTLGVRILGTGGVLVLARKRGLIDSLKTEIDKIVAAGCWLSPELIQLLLEEAGEANGR